MKTIDFENHFYTPDFLEFLSKRTAAPYYSFDTGELTWIDDECGKVSITEEGVRDKLSDLGEARLKVLDDAGMDVAVLSHAVNFAYMQDPSHIELARKHNDWLAEACRAHPDRYVGTAALPIWDIDESLREIERCVNELGFVGFHTHSNFGPNGYIDDDRYKPILAKCAELGAYVYLHPSVPHNPRYFRKYGNGFACAAFGFTMDTATTLACLVVSGIFDECPDLHVLVGHLGEGIPYYIHRITRNLEWPFCKPQCKNEKPFDWYFKHNIWLTTSGMCEKPSFMLAKEEIGADRILIGTDYPFGGMVDKDGHGYTIKFLDSLDLTPEEREMVYFRNAEELIGRELG